MGRQRRLKLVRRSGGSAVNAGVAWYRRDEWPRLREIAADPDVLEQTYDQWLALAEDAIGKLGKEGLAVKRVDIDVEELKNWCQSRGRPIDQSARAEFTSLKLHQTASASNKPYLDSFLKRSDR